MPATALLKRDWQKQHVYLITYPRCRALPNLSPWSLKLETWLRIADIPFTNISNEMKKFSAKGQVPFVELNGRQIADSNIIINALKEEFGKVDLDSTDPREQALARAFTSLAEEHLTWVVIAMRGQTGFEFLFSEDGFGPYFGTGVKRRLTLFMMKGKLKKLSTDRAMAQGMGRHSMEELNEIGKQTLKSICIFLGDKPYFGGDKPTTLDATMFGHLAGLVYMPTANGLLNKYIMENYPNLVKFVERIKEKYWPDWDETCQTKNMNAHHKKE